MNTRYLVLIVGIYLVACAGAVEAQPTPLPKPTNPPEPTVTPTIAVPTKMPPSPTTAPTNTPQSTPTLIPTDLPLPIQFNFSLYENNPVIGKGAADDWDFWRVWGGQVLKIDDAFHMFYVGIAEDSSGIGYAISTDGLEFTKHDANPILQPDGEGFDAKGISSVAPLVVADTWMLFYNASTEGERYGWNLPEGSSVGLATAPGPTGPWTAGQLVLEAGGDGEWDSGYILPTSVFFTEDGYRMYYVAESEPLDYDMMCGLATSEDGINWTKYDDPSTTEAPFADSDPVMQPSRSGWDSLGVGCSVIRTDKGWEMIFDGWSPSTTGYGYASSSDGINWSKYPKIISQGINVDSPTSAIKINSTYYIFAHDYETSAIIAATGTIDQP